MTYPPVYRWMTSVLSSMVGALVGWVSGFFLARWYVTLFMPNAGLDVVIPAILAGGSGVLIGSMLGAVSITQTRRFLPGWVVSLLLALVVLGFVLFLDGLSWRILLTMLVVAGGIGLLVEWRRQGGAAPRSHPNRK